MSALAFWQAVVQDRSNFLPRVIELLRESGIRYCVIGGFGVNAYADDFVVTQDLDIIVAVEDLERARQLLGEEFRTRQFEHSLNVYDPDSGMQVQIQLDPDVPDAVERATKREVVDLLVPVASPEDLLTLKTAAALEPRRRLSKRQKDLADIARLLEAFPELESRLAPEIKERLLH